MEPLSRFELETYGLRSHLKDLPDADHRTRSVDHALDTSAGTTPKAPEPHPWTNHEDVSGDVLERSIARLAESVGKALDAKALDLAAVLARQVDRLTEELRARRLDAAGVERLGDARRRRGGGS